LKYRKQTRRAGLKTGIHLWIVIEEYNQDLIGQSFDLEPGPPPGRFSKAFFLPVLETFIAFREQAKSVNRRG
jgi:hypothetical protein